MQDKIQVRCLNTNQRKDVKIGISLEDLIDVFDVKTDSIFANARVNNKTESLSYKVYNPATVEYIDISKSSGMRTYVRSLCFILAKAVDDILPKTEVHIEHTLLSGLYFTISKEIDDKTLNEIQSKMMDIVDKDIPFIQIEDERENVIKVFHDNNMPDKALLLEISDTIYAKYSKLGNYIDYFYGTLTPSTRYISLFEIQRYNNGFILRIPNEENPSQLKPLIKQDRLLSSYKITKKLQEVAELRSVGELNKARKENRISLVIKIAEAFQDYIINDIADKINDKFNDGVRVVLISGPSSSGKTTFRKRLEIQLYVRGLHPIGISLDDYFVDRDKTPLDENGEKDYESIYSLDIELLQNHLKTLLKGEEINPPTYNFQTGKREYKTGKLKIQSDNVLIIEGIHGLNPMLTDNIPENKKIKIFVSPLTSIKLDKHNWIYSSDNRLLRRIVRDYKYRNYSAQETIARWDSVIKGEKKWIFPFQDNADLMFNSAILYELGALKRYAEPILRRVPRNIPEYSEAQRLLEFLSFFDYITDKELPPTSLIREFLGGSSFKY